MLVTGQTVLGPERAARLRLLMLEDNRLDAELTLARLDHAGYRLDAEVVDTEDTFVAQLRTTTFDIILADFVLPSFSGVEALSLAIELAPDTPFIFVSGILGEEHAVDMLKRGATDYVLKQRLQRLASVVQRALTESAERRQRIRAERALRDTETHFRLLVDALQDYAVITLDPHGQIITWNAAARRILGYTSAEVVGRSADVIFGAKDRVQGAFDLALEAARASDSNSEDRWLWRRDGNSFFASCVITSMRNELGELLGFSTIIRDTTEAHMAADALRQAKEQAETANRAKDHFLAVLSHELRTPLTPIVTAVRLIELKASHPEELTDTLEVIKRSVELEARLIDDLLDLTSIARGKLSLNFESVDLARLLPGALEISASDLISKGLVLQTHFQASDTRVTGDAARLQQIVWNLMKNAVKFTPSGGRIDVSLSNPDASTIMVTVADTGIGISAEALPRIFSAFEQADDSITRSFGGLGLGLAIAGTLAQKHRGTLTAQSAGRGQGASFSLSLPVEAAQAASGQPLPPVQTRPGAGGPLRVLLVEDNQSTSMAMAQLLELSGHTVRLAESVAAATQATMESCFDVLISDIGLPDGSGFDVVRAWVKRQPGAPSIAITGYGMEEDVRRCREAGFSHHLTKPINLEQLENLLLEVPIKASS